MVAVIFCGWGFVRVNPFRNLVGDAQKVQAVVCEPLTQLGTFDASAELVYHSLALKVFASQTPTKGLELKRIYS